MMQLAVDKSAAENDISVEGGRDAMHFFAMQNAKYKIMNKIWASTIDERTSYFVRLLSLVVK